VPPAAAVGQPDAAAVRSMWDTVREKVNGRSKPVNAMLADAIVRAVDGDTLVLSHRAPPLAKRLSEPRNVEVIREALKDALGVNWQVRCVPDSGEPVPTDAGPAPRQDQRAEEERMLAEANSDTSEVVRRDPEEVAIELLQTELGAKRIDRG
jgi:DNA polymerase-3 subunit gamma/tau